VVRTFADLIRAHGGKAIDYSVDGSIRYLYLKEGRLAEDLHMSGNRKRNTVVGATYLVLVVVASFVAARLLAWRHQGWTGLCYMPGTFERWEPSRNEETAPKRLGWTPGGVVTTFAGSPAEAAGIATGDVVLAVNGVSTGEHDRLAQLDAQLQLHDEITYQVQRKDGSRAAIRMRLDSPLRSLHIQVSTLTGFAAALVFCALGTLVYWRKPEDQRALIFYLLSLVATIISATGPLLYVDVSARGARPFFVFTTAHAPLDRPGAPTLYVLCFDCSFCTDLPSATPAGRKESTGIAVAVLGTPVEPC
jgi:hypothetical protein